MSRYQSLKEMVLSYVPLTNDTAHLFFGLLIALLGIALGVMLKSPRPVLLSFFLSPIIAIAMEILDLRDDIGSLGYFRWKKSLGDISRTVLFPAVFLLILYATKRLRRRAR